MTFNLEGKVAIVTGGGAGIGHAIVNLLVAEGALVVTADRDLSQLEGLNVVALNVDLASPDGGPRLVDLAIETHGRLDIVVNAVGGLVPRVGGFTEITDEDWDWTLALNLRCMIRTTRAALPHLIDAGGGSIVSIASDQGRQPDPLFGDYAVAKAGVLSVSKIISLEYAKHGIRSNAVSPGPTLTPGFSGPLADMASAWGVTPEEAIHRFVHEIRKIPLGRLGDPREIANVVCFLASDLASNVTGSDYCADGGITVAA
jgi:NAD(P)-dependent dehydrogenase (short-subunit alcohol dehydrogenase family)